MLKKYAVLLVVICLLLHTGWILSESDFFNEWVVHIEGDQNQVRSIVSQYGFELVRPMPNFDNYYILKHGSVPHRSKRNAHHHTRQLTEDIRVRWAQQQVARPRSKRDVKKTGNPKNLMHFKDPKFLQQWYITGQGNHNYMNNVQMVWKMGVTGKDVVVTVVDDGLEHTHPDLARNYEPRASYDINDDDKDPMPHYVGKTWHGTRCAGEIAMVANNSVCGVGIAYNSRLGGIRLLDGPVTDSKEAMALTYNLDLIDIYSMSWGPMDNGVTLDGPHYLTALALKKGTREGRGGKGSIYVLASGNGGRKKDNCNCDGYAGSIYTISVSSITEHYLEPWYGEKCPSTLTATFSSGYKGEPKVLTTDIHKGCTEKHSGTSASAPMASAIIALALEVNPSLTWRDVQHLIAVSSKSEPLSQNANANKWYQNGAGFSVSLSFGFGLMDALDMVTRAKTWTSVPEQHVCEVTARARFPIKKHTGQAVEVEFKTDGCRGEENEVKYLEHVIFSFSMDYTHRGAISAFAISPAGTETKLLGGRDKDTVTSNFRNWPLMSVHNWGENPAGVWIFRIHDTGKVGLRNSGELKEVKLTLYGTARPPAYRNDSPETSRSDGDEEEERAAWADDDEEEEERAAWADDDGEEEERAAWEDDASFEEDRDEDDTGMRGLESSSAMEDNLYSASFYSMWGEYSQKRSHEKCL